MPSRKSPRKGSLQFWPRKRASKFLPRVNWAAIKDSAGAGKGLKGFICYKAGMASAFVKDVTEHSMTKGKRIVTPVTILECPPMKILSVRFYNHGKVVGEVLAENFDKELKRKIKSPKKKHGKPEDFKKEFDDVKIICHSVVKKTGIKKTPDLAEIGLSGSKEDKINFVKENIGKEMPITDAFADEGLTDVRGLTRGHGLVGPVRRFGISLKSHKSEKGQRRPGSLAPWHPARVTFRTPMAGQLGMFTRTSYNNKIIKIGKPDEETISAWFKGIKNFGDVKADYMILRGSVQGPSKRQLLLTSPLRETKKQLKKKFEFLELR